MLKVQVSLYPVEQEEVTSLQGLSSQFLNEHALDYDMHPGLTSLDTTIAGNEDEVWTALRHLLQANLQVGHDVVMVTTMTYWGGGEHA
ncbi:MAG: hypothetical protein M0R49_05760 [Limnochordia bacterium]|jgi:uncharacterized protein YqgV (UPF0045/DUF77 family)|nr:hypothetical protein [Limnochordia bacterium]